jgi:uncharacterized SAM-binding protein YcdF (DUF218 family)
MNEWIVLAKRLLDTALLPPGGPLLLLLAGLIGLWSSRRSTSKRKSWLPVVLIVLATGLIYVSSTRAFLWWFAQGLEQANPSQTEQSLKAAMASPDAPQAVVILGGGTRLDERETPQAFALHPRTLQRVQHGVWVARQTRLPILTSGGQSRANWPPEAATMAEVIERDFLQPVRWRETGSLDTRDNAYLSAKILKTEGISKVILVTHAAHMPRSKREFEAAGLKVVAAPHGFSGAQGGSMALAWLPSADVMGSTWLVAHEWLGGLWYRISAMTKQFP